MGQVVVDGIGAQTDKEGLDGVLPLICGVT